jgi:hypothetical protein
MVMMVVVVEMVVGMAMGAPFRLEILERALRDHTASLHDHHPVRKG